MRMKSRIAQTGGVERAADAIVRRLGNAELVERRAA
jgi:hypothetical protein